MPMQLFQKKKICLDMFFDTKLKEDQTEALEWLQIILQTKNLPSCFGQLLLEELLVPINLNNQHWILVTIGVFHCCYFAINLLSSPMLVQENSIYKQLNSSIGHQIMFIIFQYNSHMTLYTVVSMSACI